MEEKIVEESNRLLHEIAEENKENNNFAEYSEKDGCYTLKMKDDVINTFSKKLAESLLDNVNDYITNEWNDMKEAYTNGVKMLLETYLHECEDKAGYLYLSDTDHETVSDLFKEIDELSEEY